jgi:hypothetical protein
MTRFTRPMLTGFAGAFGFLEDDVPTAQLSDSRGAADMTGFIQQTQPKSIVCPYRLLTAY